MPFFSCCRLLPLQSSTAKPTYAVIAPSIIRPNSDYHVSVDLVNATKPVDIKVEVTGGEPTQIGRQRTNRVSRKISLKPNESSGWLNLNIGEWQDDNYWYKLIVKGKSDELDFEEEATLEFEPKSCSIFVQTDKSIYKPGQAVKFRAIVVNSSLIPNVAGTLDVLVKDSKDNLIKQWKRVSAHLGVFSEEFQLSDQPPLGDWSIIVETRGQKYSKDFTVVEYVLPTFSVDIEIPPYATYAQSEVVATVKANYTYGKPVKGDCILTVHSNWGRSQMEFRIIAKITDGGTVEMPIDLIEDLDLRDKDHEREIEFHATVTENLTGKKYSSSSKLIIYPKNTKVELVKTSNTFKPGLKYTAFLKVAYQDDKPVEDNGPPVKLKYIFAKSGPDQTELIQESVPVKGIVLVEVNTPRNEKHVDYMRIEWRAEYRGETYYLETIENAKSPSNSFIQVLAKNDQSSLEDLFVAKSASVGEEITFQVNAVEPLTEVVYKVMTKGDIVLASTIKPKDAKSRSLDITIRITKQMAPKARLLVYYVREGIPEIVADVFNFKVDGVFSTPVHMSSNVTETEPGGQVDITVQTQPSAYVGLLGIDQSILLLKTGNDLTREDVLQDLESYDSGRMYLACFGAVSLIQSIVMSPRLRVRFSMILGW